VGNLAEPLTLGLGILGGVVDIWTLKKAIETKEPKLVIEKIYVANFSFFPTIEVRRFIIAKVRNVGESSANHCIGTMFSNDIDKKEFKLHWADIPYAALRNSTTPIDIKPNETRDLDIAFSVGGIINTAENRTMTSAPTIATGSNISPMGTFDALQYTQEYMNKESLDGAWVATPFALLACKSVKEDYLKPGDYLARIKIMTDVDGQGDEKLIVINSTPTWSDLNAIAR
jgi:hypothetical protein